jgi:hypothetical protein
MQRRYFDPSSSSKVGLPIKCTFLRFLQFLQTRVTRVGGQIFAYWTMDHFEQWFEITEEVPISGLLF